MSVTRLIKRTVSRQDRFKSDWPASDTRALAPDTAEKLEGDPDRSSVAWSCRSDSERLFPITQLDDDDPRLLLPDDYDPES
ncbi:MAG: hypothetical protein Alpg2KO_00780 [Alphaproteobacteria bacterium]